MPLETGTYIDDLVPSNPAASDPTGQGDDHIRLIKSVLKNTFPNIDGPVTATQAQINVPVPLGVITMWYGSAVAIPDGWALCDGGTYARSDGGGDVVTPDLRGRFVVGVSGSFAGGSTGGATTALLTSANLPPHTHTVSLSGTTGSGGGHSHTAVSGLDGAHSHSATIGMGGAHIHQMFKNTDRSDQPLQDATADQFATVRSSAGDSNNRYYIQASNGGSATLGRTSNSGNHDHSISIANSSTHNHTITVNAAAAHTHSVSLSGATGSTGSGSAFSILPPYLALHYIMKI